MAQMSATITAKLVITNIEAAEAMAEAKTLVEDCIIDMPWRDELSEIKRNLEIAMEGLGVQEIES